MTQLQMLLFGKPYPIPAHLVRAVVDNTQEDKPPRQDRASAMIAHLQKAGGWVCVLDVANALNMRPSNARDAIRSLQGRGRVETKHQSVGNRVKLFARYKKG